MLWLLFVAYLLLRRYGGPGSEKLAAGVAIFGMVNVPFIYPAHDEEAEGTARLKCPPEMCPTAEAMIAIARP